MPLQTRILHDEREYLVSEEAAAPLEPRIRLFARPDDPTFEEDISVPRVRTDQGEWRLISWFDGEQLQLASAADEERRELIQQMFGRYIQYRSERSAKATNVCYYLHVKGRPVFTLHRAQPGGLMLSLFRQQADAEAALKRLAPDGKAISTGPLWEFLKLRAEEGFAGALLDEDEPIYWCLDPEDHLQFLRIRPDETAAELEGHLLDPSGRWTPYEGDESLEFLHDEEHWDELMCSLLGRLPFLGHEAAAPLFALFRDGVPTLQEDPEEELTIVPLFLDRAGAEQYCQDEGLADLTIESVADLRPVIRSAQDRGAFVQLQPGDHRARSGRLWLDGDSVVLETYSGFWRSSGDAHFQQVP